MSEQQRLPAEDPSGTARPERSDGGPSQIVPLTTHRRIVPIPQPPPTTFVGRDAEVSLALELLRRDDVRVVTLTGPGGIGKTRLALETAAIVGADFVDGVVWVPLAPIRDPGLVVSAIASALGIGEANGHNLHRGVTSALRTQRMLLVLDNFEQVLAAAAPLADILRACPAVKALVTSRAPLRISGEHVLPVPPLALPDLHDQRSPEHLLDVEAVRLFRDRAEATLPSFEITTSTGPQVGRICQRLDGLPLAIELAAARVSHLSVQTLHDRLERSLPLLTGGPRDAPDRQQTLRSTISWSYDLLSREEQTLFRQLAVFGGGFTLEAAEAVGTDGATVLDRLTALVDTSLVQYRPHARGGARYALLVTVREFAAERLAASGGEEAARQRHAAFFLALAQEAEPDLTRGTSRTLVNRLDADHDNLRLALSWLAETRQWQACLQLAIGLSEYWDVRGYLSEGRTWLERALEQASQTDTPAALFALARTRLGLLLLRQDNLDEAEAQLDTAREVWLDQGNTEQLAFTLSLLGGVADYRGDHRPARELYERALTLYRQLADSSGTAHLYNHLADLACQRGDVADAMMLAEEAVSVARRAGLDVVMASALVTVAEVTLVQGDLPGALRVLRQGLDASRGAGYVFVMADVLSGLAVIAAASGDAARAARLLGAVDVLAEGLGVRRIPHETLHRRAITAARAALGADAYSAAWSEGYRLSLDDLLAEAEAVQIAPSSGPWDRFTPRERDVLRLLVTGLTDRAIGETLFIGTRTVEGHVANILSKLGVRTRAAAVAAAIAAGLVDPPPPPSDPGSET